MAQKDVSAPAKMSVMQSFMLNVPEGNRSFLGVFLCLSRACLGKMMHSIMYKWLKKTVFTHRALRAPPSSSVGRSR
eukprot:COSAG06_NODE_357_length_16856_cov_7.212687_9_plen_76_part_00